MNIKHYIIDDFELFLLTVLVHIGVETFAQSAGSALVPVRKKEMTTELTMRKGEL